MDGKLKYRDERDKTYGIAGMAIAMIMSDGEDMLVEVSLDSPEGESMRFSPDFYFQGNPRYSAKLAWNQMLKQMSLATGMLIGNVMCRNYILDHKPLSREVVDELRSIVDSEAAELCSLESDESERLFRQNFSYFDRVFNHRQVAMVAENFAGELRHRRHMTLHEILDQLRSLESF